MRQLRLLLLVLAATGGAEAKIVLRDYGLRDYVRVSHDLPHREDQPWKLICALPYNCQFQPWLQVDAPPGLVLRVNSTNPLVLYLTKTESQATLAGQSEYEARKWVSGEGACYTIPAGVTVKAVKYRETGVDTDFAGSFECNDEDFNILWRRGARTAYLCMRDHFYDCPDRERVGFWGDGTPELNHCFYVFDSRSHQLAQDLVRRKLQPKFYPGQHLEFLGEYGLWFYYLHTGDLESLAAVYEPTKTFLLETYQFGHPGTWFDWGVECKDTAVIETCFWYQDVATLRKIALATGHEADLPLLDAKLAEVKSSFDARYWRGKFYQSDQVKTPDDRANAMAVNAGLAGPEKWESLYTEVLGRTTNASCFFDRWVFEALCTMGKPDQALLRMVGRYRTMIESSVTTLWEHYDRWWASRRNCFDDASSLNHGWNPPAIVLPQNIVGVRPLEPGWRVFEVLPREAFLTSLKSVTPTVKGPVAVELHKSATEYSLTVTVPPATTCVLGLPLAAFSRLDTVLLDGAPVWPGTLGRAEGGYLKFRLVPGTARLSGRGALPLASPKPPRPAPRPEVRLDPRGWVATASVPDGSFLFSGAKIPLEVGAANAVDGDVWTGWRDMTRTQYPGQWFQVDLRAPQTFDRLALDNTWALWDSPNAYAVTVSDNGVDWSAPIATGRGQLGITSISFAPRTARFVRVTQTGSDPTYHWSIYEFQLYRGTH